MAEVSAKPGLIPVASVPLEKLSPAALRPFVERQLLEVDIFHKLLGEHIKIHT